MTIRRVGILTGGGDCPGLNAVIRAAARSAHEKGWEVWGVHGAFGGMLDGEQFQRLWPRDVRGILNRGGTILGTTNRVNPFEVAQPDGSTRDESDRVLANYERRGLDALICIGGDGTLRIAQRFVERGLPVVGVPKTIDNDLASTVVTFGYDTAVSVATDAIDKLHPTAESHHRVMVVEVMGRHAGWIALNSGIAGGADVILIPEIPFDLERVCDKVRQRDADGCGFSILVVAEGACQQGGDLVHQAPAEVGRERRLGGIGNLVSREVERRTGKETRCLVLGHLQRGGHPTTFDRLLGTRFGVAAVQLVERRDFGKMVALDPPSIVAVPIREAVAALKTVPPDSDEIAAARAIGVSFGD